MKKVILTMLITTLVFSGTILAQARFGDSAHVCVLEATRLGLEYEAGGEAQIGVVGADQYIAFKIEADLKDGTVLVLAVENDQGVADIGAEKVEMGLAVFRMYSRSGLSPAFPTDKIRKVFVRLGKEEILEGSFIREQ